MKVETKKQKARDILKRWDAKYTGTLRNLHWDTRNKLEELGVDPTPERVNEVIGNSSWTGCYCQECERACNAVVRLGRDPQYEKIPENFWVCLECLKEALALLEKVD